MDRPSPRKGISLSQRPARREKERRFALGPACTKPSGKDKAPRHAADQDQVGGSRTAASAFDVRPLPFPPRMGPGVWLVATPAARFPKEAS